jgi:hypothetical protein
MDRSDASALADLQMHWDEAYVIRLDGNVWSARFRDSADELRAHTSTELRELIRSDYAYRQRAGQAVRGSDVTAGSDADPEDDIAVGVDGEQARDVPTTEQDGAVGSAAVERGLSAAARQYAAEVNFAAIRGERMST